MQRTKNISRSKRIAAAALILACGAVWSAPASADPPPWAPAWGYRAKGKNKHRVQQAYVPPYDIGLGRCNRNLIGGLLGGAAKLPVKMTIPLVLCILPAMFAAVMLPGMLTISRVIIPALG